MIVKPDVELHFIIILLLPCDLNIEFWHWVRIFILILESWPVFCGLQLMFTNAELTAAHSFSVSSVIWRGRIPASDMHLSQRLRNWKNPISSIRTAFIFLLQLLPGCPASPPWMRVEGKPWRLRPLRSPLPPPQQLAPTPPAWPDRAQGRRMKPSPSWRTSSWTSWTKSHVSFFFFFLY